MRNTHICSLLLAASIVTFGPLGHAQSGPPGWEPTTVTVAPTAAQVAVGERQTFTALLVNGRANDAVRWTATWTPPSPRESQSDEWQRTPRRFNVGYFSPRGPGNSGDTITWTAPDRPGTVTITAAALFDPSATAKATVTVTEKRPKQCVTSEVLGICGPYSYVPVSGTNGTNVNVLQDFWNSAAAPAGSTQTMYSDGPGKWHSVANFPTGNTAVETFPDSDAIYYGPIYTGTGCITECDTPNYSTIPLVTSFKYIYGSYAEDMHANSNTSSEAAYDIWLNDYANEVMIWVDRANRSLYGCTPLGSDITFGGSNGVPTHVWDVCKYGSEIIWYLDQPSLGTGTATVYGISTGSVDIYDMLMWLENNGTTNSGTGKFATFLPTTSDLWQIEFGFEICSTGAENEDFDLSGFSINSGQPAQ